MGFVIEIINNLKLEKQALKKRAQKWSKCITKRNGWGVCDLKWEWNYILSKTVDILDQYQYVGNCPPTPPLPQ